MIMNRKKCMDGIGRGRGMALCAALVATIMVPAAAGAAGINDTIANALQGDWGRITLDLRYRYEHVDQDGLKTANGDPLRIRLGYLTPKFSGLQAFAEFEGNNSVFLDDYNNTDNNKTDYAVIADPNKGELNQAWLSWSGYEGTVVKAGRQRMNWDDQRFIGAVGWRQMEQTFDAVSVFSTPLPNLDLKLSYVWNVRNIKSRDVNMSSPLVNIAYTFSGIGRLSAYAYLLDYNDEADYGLSSQTYGLRFNGTAPVSDALRLLYTAEYAVQSDYQDNPADYSADYYHFIGGITYKDVCPLVSSLSASVAWMLQSSDNGVSFKTPLGTNHKFNGWADQFLTTPDTGLRDLYGTVGAMIHGHKVQVVYHQFDADQGGADYGDEWDFLVQKKINEHYSV
ncbi:MAG TPA: hypothetical protein ENI88_02695, partial [Desulfobulbus sp.]|nr:hypothetical protein [Desulfobulbus sp.]